MSKKSSSTRGWLQLTLQSLTFILRIITRIHAVTIDIDPSINPITVNDGQISTLKCHVGYSPEKPTITWTIGDREIVSSSHRTVSSSTNSQGLSITNELRYTFQSYDNGQTITCKARQPDGSWVSSYTQLSVVQSQNVQQSHAQVISDRNEPEATINSVNIDPGINPITVTAGRTPNVKCHVGYTIQAPTITWTIGSREIASSDHGTVTSSVGSFTDALRYNFQSYDHGQTIKCMARLPDGSWKSSYSQLNVVQSQIVQQTTPPPPPPAPVSNTPAASVITNVDIEPSGNPITVNAGQKTDIKCLVGFIGQSQSPVITWKIGNREIDIPKTVTSNPAPIYPGQYGLGSTTNILRYHFQSSDNGQTITCTARLADGTWKSSYTQLRVLGSTTGVVDVASHSGVVNHHIEVTSAQPNTKLPTELKGINWSQYIDGSAMLNLPSGQTVPTGFTVGHSYFLGLNNPNFAYQTCKTPRGESGRCRFLQHCARPQIIVSLSTFLTYACPIGNDFMGVCCPESEVETSTAKNPPPPPPTTINRPTTTTARPTTIAPKISTTTKPQANRKGCGDLIKETTRIVGGQQADAGEWPWMAALLRDTADQYCGGVLITDQHVLTASHCVARFKPHEVTVRLGEYEFSKASNSRRDFAVDAIFIHEQYERRTVQNDIALIRLKEKATFNDMIWPICLPPSNTVLEGQSAYVAGWGTTSFQGSSSDSLLEILLPIWQQEDCQKSYINKTITDKQLCAGYKQGGRDSCQGDSGGPLMWQMTSGRWAVVGIVSWGHRCGEKNHPGVYARVTSYSDWIKAKVLA